MTKDYNCFAGSWPSAMAKRAALDELRAVHETHGIEAGCVSCLDSVLDNDPVLRDLEFSKQLNGKGYDLALSMNPMLPNIGRDMDIADDNIDYKAFRIYPSIHGYKIDSPELLEFMDMAAQKAKPVLMACTFGDARLDYIIRQNPLDTGEIGAFIENTRATLVLCNIKIGEIEKIKKQILSRDNVYIDMSELKHSLFSIEDIKNMGLHDRLVFGSFFPLFDFGCSYIHFRGEKEKTSADILSRSIY